MLAGQFDFVGQNRLRASDSGGDFVGRGALVNRHLAQLPERVPRQIAGVERRAVQYDNFHFFDLNSLAVEPGAEATRPIYLSQEIDIWPRRFRSGFCFYQFTFLMRAATSMALSRELNAETRKKPSPCAPKPEPGVTTTLASCSILSKTSQLVRPDGVAIQI